MATKREREREDFSRGRNQSRQRTEAGGGGGASLGKADDDGSAEVQQSRMRAKPGGFFSLSGQRACAPGRGGAMRRARRGGLKSPRTTPPTGSPLLGMCWPQSHGARCLRLPAGPVQAFLSAGLLLAPFPAQNNCGGETVFVTGQRLPPLPFQGYLLACGQSVRLLLP